MTPQSFTLKPFPGEGPRFSLEIKGAIARRGATLDLRYELRGDVAAVRLPGPACRPGRRHGLWEETCFEFFLAPQNSPRYWEFNLSPAGHWNVYSFQEYRLGMQEEPAIASLPAAIRRKPDELVLALKVEVAGIIPLGQPLVATIAAVIQGQDFGITYWALTHTGSRPDFHRREAFIIRLESLPLE